MKTSLVAAAFALSLTFVPATVQAFDMGTLTPTLDFPEPSPEPVRKDRSGIDK